MILTMALMMMTAPPAEVAEKAADPRDKMVCKRFAKTGSLVSTYRSCKPKREWDRERDNLRVLNVSDSCRTAGQGVGCGL